MNPIELEITIARPPEEVFAYLADIANHPEFTDHYLKEWRLTRVDSVGAGAGARFRVAAPRRRFAFADLNFVEVKAPLQIVAFGRGGKYNRTKTSAEWTLEPAGPGKTRVRYVYESDPPLPTDKIFESLGSRGWTKRKSRKALLRLQSNLEDGELKRGQRASVAGL